MYNLELLATPCHRRGHPEKAQMGWYGLWTCFHRNLKNKFMRPLASGAALPRRPVWEGMARGLASMKFSIINRSRAHIYAPAPIEESIQKN